jgi:hypothetical protein
MIVLAGLQSLEERAQPDMHDGLPATSTTRIF